MGARDERNNLQFTIHNGKDKGKRCVIVVGDIAPMSCVTKETIDN